MEWVEVTGTSVDAAKEAALAQLGVEADDAEILIVSEPTKGLFGRVRGEARVKARVKPAGPRPKRNRNRRERSGAGEGGGNREGQQRQQKAAGDGERQKGSAPQGNRNKPQREGQQRPKQEEREMADGMTLEEQAKVGQEFLKGLLDAYGYQADVAIRNLDDETVELSVTGEELGLLVGPRGSTLAALQDITRTVVQAKFTARTDRILVDVAQYRERRVAALTRWVQGIAEEVKASGEERPLEPMSAADRKVIHDTVATIDGVETRSEGEDARRHVVIAPSA